MHSKPRSAPLVLAFLAPFAAALAACRSDGRDASQGQFQVVHASAEALRSAFNVDSGKVRAIFLASPT